MAPKIGLNMARQIRACTMAGTIQGNRISEATIGRQRTMLWIRSAAMTPSSGLNSSVRKVNRMVNQRADQKSASDSRST